MKKFVGPLINGVYGLEGMVHTELFEDEIIIRSRYCSEQYVKKCAEYFVEMPETLKEKLLRATAAFALDYVEQNGLDDPDIEWNFTKDSPVTDILKYIFPVVINIPQPRDITEEDAPPCFDMELSCVWELEMGMEWVVRGEDALYVGSFEGHSPWDYVEQSDSNYVNRI